MWRNSVTAYQWNRKYPEPWEYEEEKRNPGYLKFLKVMEVANTTHPIFSVVMKTMGSFLSLKDAEEYCIGRGWKFRVDNSLYGGYYVEESTGRSFIVI